VDDTGELNFRRDTYERDRKIIEALVARPEFDLST